MRTHRSVFLAAALLSACGPASELGSGASSLTDSSALELAVLDFANTASPDELNAVVNSNAALAIEAVRPLPSIADLALVSYVGDAALDALLAHVAPAEAEAGAGFWEETLLSATEASATLQMANTLDKAKLECGVGLTATMTDRVMAARTLADVGALVAVPYFGASHLRRFKGASAWFLTGGASGTPYDCVYFSDEQQQAALTFVNEASWSELCAVGGCGFGGWTTQATLITSHRPWASLGDVSAQSGIGSWGMTLIRIGADRVLSEVAVLGSDSIVRMNAGEVSSGYVQLEPMRVLELVDIWRFYKPATGVSIGPRCARIADWDDTTPDESGHSALLCEIDFAGIQPAVDALAGGTPYTARELRWLWHDGHVVLYDQPTAQLTFD